MMTGHADVSMAVEAMKEGAVDFIEKPFGDEIFLAAVRSTLLRQQTASRRSSELLQAQARLRSLSEREQEVLDGLVNGKPNKVIAYDLGISPRTVEIYRATSWPRCRRRACLNSFAWRCWSRAWTGLGLLKDIPGVAGQECSGHIRAAGEVHLH